MVYPRRGGSLRDTVFKLVLHPSHGARALGLLHRALLGAVFVIGRGGDRAQGAAQTVISDDLGHPQDAGGHAITTQRAYMSVTTVPIEDRQHPGTQRPQVRVRWGWCSSVGSP